MGGSLARNTIIANGFSLGIKCVFSSAHWWKARKNSHSYFTRHETTTTTPSLHHPLLLLLSVSGEPAGATATNQPPNRRGLLQLLKPKTKYYTTTLECGLSGFPGAWRILKRASSFARLQKQPRHSCRQPVLVGVENPIKNSL